MMNHHGMPSGCLPLPGCRRAGLVIPCQNSVPRNEIVVTHYAWRDSNP